jgi:hypothetical protein
MLDAMSHALLLACPSCARHIRVDSKTCPFCEREPPATFGTGPAPRYKRPTRRTETLVYLAGTSALVAACGRIVNVMGEDASTDGSSSDRTSSDGTSADSMGMDSTLMDQVAVPYGISPPSDGGMEAACPDACPTMCCHDVDDATTCCSTVPYGLPPPHD